MSQVTKPYQASLLAFAVGDALGATTEFCTPAEIRNEYGVHRDIIGGGWLDLEPGQITDDTEMTLCVARSLVEHRGFVLSDVADRFVDWYNSDPVDIGSTCRAGIHRYIKTGKLEAPFDINGAGNGGVMRSLPLALWFAGDREALLHATVAQSRLTHNNPESDLGCCCYADLVAAALGGSDKEELKSIADGYPQFAPEMFDGKSGGYVVETMRSVLHCFFTTDSLEGALIRAANLGGDADTVAALLGGLVGAFYGYDAIPVRWLDMLERGINDECEKLGLRLQHRKDDANGKTQ